MKKVFFGSAMLAVLLLAGCEKEQSQLTLDGMTSVAKVQGKVTYDAGRKWRCCYEPGCRERWRRCSARNRV